MAKMKRCEYIWIQADPTEDDVDAARLVRFYRGLGFEPSVFSRIQMYFSFAGIYLWKRNPDYVSDVSSEDRESFVVYPRSPQ
jgi:hypothetical protein